MDGYTGRIFEEEILGACLWSWRGAGYLSYSRCVREVMRHQPADPADPKNRAANDLHFLVAEALGEEDCSQLGLYTAVGSPLDRFHSVDGFFLWNRAVVTVDLTCNGKKETYRADFIIHKDEVYTGDGQINRERLERRASSIAHLLKRRGSRGRAPL